VRALDGESRSLDRWILERGAPQTVTFYRKGLELVRNLNEQGLTQIEQAMSWEANSAVFTPLFLRYISLTQAWEAYVREAQFFDRLVQQYPSSPQVQAAAAVRRSAQTQVQFFEIGIREIEQALEQERENILARTLKAALLAQRPRWKAQTIMAFESIQQATQANPAQAKMVAYYRQNARYGAVWSGEPSRSEPQAIRAAYLPARLNLQIKEIAPQAWEAIQRGRSLGYRGTEGGLSALEKVLESKVDDPTAFGVVLARYLEMAQEVGKIPRAVAVCAELAENQPKSPQAKAAYGYVLATAQLEDIVAEGLIKIEQALARDPDNFFIRTVRIMQLAQVPWNVVDAERALKQERETGRFQIAALDAVLAQAASTRHMMISTQSASSSTNR